MRYEAFICMNGMEDEGPSTMEQIGRLETLLTEADTNVSVENDGIGPYEFWGARYNDKGTDYGIVEGGDEITVRFFIRGFDPEKLGDLTLAEWAEETIRGSASCGQDVDLCPNAEYEEAFVTVEAEFKKVAEEVNGDEATVTLKVEWTTDGGIH